MQQASIEVPGDYSVRVRLLRGCIELTQAQLAKRIGVSFATVNRWENSQSKPTRLAWQQILDLEAEIATSEGAGEPTAAAAETPSVLNFAAKPSLEAAEPVEVVRSWSDISAVKEAEAKKEARAQVERLLASSPAVIYSFKATGDFGPTFVSQNIKDLAGLRAARLLESPDFWRRCVHPDDLPRVEAEFGQLFKKGRHTLEYRFLKKDGSYCWVSDELRLVYDKSGEPDEVVGSWSDITARRAAEEAAAEARAQVERLLASSPAVIYSFKATGDFGPTFVSQNIKDLAGLRAARLLGEPGLLAALRASRRPSRGGGRVWPPVQERPPHPRVPVSQEGRQLLLGQRRVAPRL